jgi:hypothetical protein
MEAMFEASGGRLSVVSGYRSIAEQQELWNNSAQDGVWVAAPGKSNHNHGVAVDLGYETDDALDWAHANAARFGLVFPMDWEPWHIEPSGVRDGTYHSEVHVDGEAPGQADSYTIPPPGELGATDTKRRGDLKYQLMALNSILMSPMNSMLGQQGARPLAGEPSRDVLEGTGGAV